MQRDLEVGKALGGELPPLFGHGAGGMVFQFVASQGRLEEGFGGQVP